MVCQLGKRTGGLPDAWDVGCLRGHRPAAHLARDGGEGWPVALGPAHCRHDGLAAHGVVDIFGPGAGGEGNRPPDVLSVSDLLPLSFLQSQTRLSLTSFRCRLETGRNDQRFGLYIAVRMSVFHLVDTGAGVSHSNSWCWRWSRRDLQGWTRRARRDSLTGPWSPCG